MYMKLLRNHANNHLPFSDLPYDQYALRGGRQRGKNRHFSYVIARDATGIGRIQNRTTGGGSSRRRASFLYTSHLRGIKIHILNCCRSLKKFAGVCQGSAANRRGSNRGQHYSFLLHSENSLTEPEVTILALDTPKSSGAIEDLDCVSTPSCPALGVSGVRMTSQGLLPPGN